MLIRLLTSLLLLTAIAAAAPQAPQPLVLFWPNAEQPQIRVTFSAMRQAFSTSEVYVADVLVENISPKAMPRASFTIYLYDNDHVRIGDGTLMVSDLDAGQRAKVQVTLKASGRPVSLALKARTDSSGAPAALKTVAVRIISKPPASKLKLDGEDAGITPITISVPVGNHTLELSKEGFATTTAPLDVNADETAGGSITVELGGLTSDTVVLRDGSLITGDLDTVTATEVVLRVNGETQKIERNRVQRIHLVERQIVETPAANQPDARKPANGSKRAK